MSKNQSNPARFSRAFGGACAMAAFLAATPVAAQMEHLQLGFVHDSLTGNRSDWVESMAQAAFRFAPESRGVLASRYAERYDDTAREITYEGHTKLGAAGVHYTFGVGSENSFFAEKTYGVGAGWALGGGWVVDGSVKRKQYANNDSDTLRLGFERYFGNWRAGYVLNQDISKDVGSDVRAHAVSLSYYFGERASMTLAVSDGKESDVSATGQVLAPVDVRTVAVYGEMPMGKDWSLLPSVGWTEQGTNYERVTLGLAVRFTF